MFGSGEQRPGVLEQRLPCSGELNTVGVTLHEGGSDALFELVDLAAERLLGEVQPRGGAGEVELLGEGQERAKVPHLDVHRVAVCPCDSARLSWRQVISVSLFGGSPARCAANALTRLKGN